MARALTSPLGGGALQDAKELVRGQKRKNIADGDHVWEEWACSCSCQGAAETGLPRGAGPAKAAVWVLRLP